jgi:hypothetical protein
MLLCHICNGQWEKNLSWRLKFPYFVACLRKVWYHTGACMSQVASVQCLCNQSHRLPLAGNSFKRFVGFLFISFCLAPRTNSMPTWFFFVCLFVLVVPRLVSLSLSLSLSFSSYLLIHSLSLCIHIFLSIKSIEVWWENHYLSYFWSDEMVDETYYL